MPPTPTRLLADTLLPGGIDQFIAERRNAKVSWRRIALALRDATDARVDVTEETVKAWSRNTERAA